MAIRRLGSDKQEVLELGAAVIYTFYRGTAALLGAAAISLPAPETGALSQEK